LSGPDEAAGAADHATPPTAPSWTLRPAGAADLDFLVALRLATMAPQFARQGIVHSAEEHRLRAEYRLDAAQIIEHAGRPIGLLKLLRADDTWEVRQLQIAPGFQGRGLGGAVLRRVIAEADAQRAPLTLGVLKLNPARRLYARLGFAICGESDDSFAMRRAARAG
jgi:GNAT superfamily N-acetyltransferase